MLQALGKTAPKDNLMVTAIAEFSQPDNEKEALADDILRETESINALEASKAQLDLQIQRKQLSKMFKWQKYVAIADDREVKALAKETGTQPASVKTLVNKAESLYRIEGNDENLTPKQKLDITQPKYEPVLEKLELAPMTEEQVQSEFQAINREIKNRNKAKQLSFDKHNDGSSELVIRLPDGESTRKVYLIAKEQPVISEFLANLIDGVAVKPPEVIDNTEQMVMAEEYVQSALQQNTILEIELEEVRDCFKDLQIENKRLSQQNDDLHAVVFQLQKQLAEFHEQTNSIPIPEEISEVGKKISQMLAEDDRGLQASDIGISLELGLELGELIAELYQLENFGIIKENNSYWTLV